MPPSTCSMISRRWSNAFPSTRPLPMSWGAPTFSVSPLKLQLRYGAVCGQRSVFPKARHDYEYDRNGVANLFMVFAPLEGWRHVKVTDRHTAIDYAHVLRDLFDTHFPDAAKIVLVQDNLNIHKPASLYEAFPAPEARRLVERFAWY